MIWTDILIERNLSNAEIKKTIGKILNVPIHDILIVSKYEDFPKAGSKFIVCLKTLFKKGFRVLLSFYFFDDAYMNALEVDTFVADFSRYSKSRCLISTESPNPYQMYLFDMSNAKRLVNLDSNRLDTKEEYCLEGEQLG